MTYAHEPIYILLVFSLFLNYAYILALLNLGLHILHISLRFLWNNKSITMRF